MGKRETQNGLKGQKLNNFNFAGKNGHLSHPAKVCHRGRVAGVKPLSRFPYPGLEASPASTWTSPLGRRSAPSPGQSCGGSSRRCSDGVAAPHFTCNATASAPPPSPRKARGRHGKGSRLHFISVPIVRQTTL